jgi:hypothetical protein
MATTLPRNGDLPGGRAAQSSAFLSTPGIEALYSGVTTSTAPARATASFISTTGAGIPMSSTSPS